MSDEERFGSLQLALPDGSVLSAGWGFAGAAAWLPGVRWVARLTARSPSFARLLDRVYWTVAAHRGWLARYVPDVAAVQRPPTG